MVDILLVHGRSRPQFGPVEMREQWLVALHNGFEAADLDMPFTDDEVRLPWYGGALRELVGGVARGEAERVSLRGALPMDERAFVREVVEEVAAGYHFTPEQLAAAAHPDEVDAPEGSWARVRTVLAAIDRYVPGMSGATIAFVARECFGYLTNEELRSRIDDGVASLVRPGVPTIVVAHSLGAVIAYHTLRAHPEAEGWDVPLLITMGAPLAWAPVVRALERLDTRRMPAPVRTWVNVRDVRDGVAIEGDLSGSLLPAGPGLPEVMEERGVVNPEDGRHAIEYYLADPVVARRIVEAVPA